MRPARFAGPLVLVLAVIAALAHRAGWLDTRVFDLALACAVAFTTQRFAVRLGAPERASALLAFGLLAATLAAALWVPGVQLAPYVAIVPVNLGMAWIFGQGLRPGRTPVILTLIRLMGAKPAITPAFERFVRGQCTAWTTLGLMLAAVAFIAMVAPAARPWADPATASLMAVQVLWFVLSHSYARRIYGRSEGWRDTAALMARPATWDKLGVGG